MGTIAHVYGWSLETLDALDLGELVGFHQDAVALHNRLNAPPPK